jgi:hypothetical protein
VDYVIYKLAKRVNNPSWLVALKALMTFHRLLRECDASFAEQVRRTQQQQGQRGCTGCNRSKGSMGALDATAARAGWHKAEGACKNLQAGQQRAAGERVDKCCGSSCKGAVAADAQGQQQQRQSHKLEEPCRRGQHDSRVPAAPQLGCVHTASRIEHSKNQAARIRAGWCAVDVGSAPCHVVPVSGCASKNITAAKHLTNDIVHVRMRLQVVQFADRTGRHHMLGLDRFADHTGREAWDYSAWVRVYSTYLDERLGAFRCVQLQSHAPPGV